MKDPRQLSYVGPLEVCACTYGSGSVRVACDRHTVRRPGTRSEACEKRAKFAGSHSQHRMHVELACAEHVDAEQLTAEHACEKSEQCVHVDAEHHEQSITCTKDSEQTECNQSVLTQRLVDISLAATPADTWRCEASSVCRRSQIASTGFVSKAGWHGRGGDDLRN